MAHAALWLAGSTGPALREIQAVLTTRGAPETPTQRQQTSLLGRHSIGSRLLTRTHRLSSGLCVEKQSRSPAQPAGAGAQGGTHPTQEHANLGEAGHAGHLGRTPLSSGAPRPSRTPRSVQSAAGGPGCVRPWRWRPCRWLWLAGGRTSRTRGGRAAAWPPARRPAGRSSSSGGSR